MNIHSSLQRGVMKVKTFLMKVRVKPSEFQPFDSQSYPSISMEIQELLMGRKLIKMRQVAEQQTPTEFLIFLQLTERIVISPMLR